MDHYSRGKNKQLISIWQECINVFHFVTSQCYNYSKHLFQQFLHGNTIKKKKNNLINHKGVVFYHDNGQFSTTKITFEKTEDFILTTPSFLILYILFHQIIIYPNVYTTILMDDFLKRQKLLFLSFCPKQNNFTKNIL